MSKLLQGGERSESWSAEKLCFASVLWQDDSVFPVCDVLAFLFKVKNLRNCMFSLTSLSVFSLRGCSYYLCTPALCSCLGFCSLSEITHWVHVPETGVSFVTWYPRYNTSPAQVHSIVVMFLKTGGFLREEGCDRKDAIILIIPIMTPNPGQALQTIEVYFSPDIYKEMTQPNVGDSHLKQRELI